MPQRKVEMCACIALATEDDAREMLEIYRPVVENTIASFELVAPEAAEFRDRVRTAYGRQPWLVCRDGNGASGFSYAAPHRHREAYRWSVETSVYVRAERRRQGVGTALYTSLLAVLRLLGYCNAYAGIALPNVASVAMHERVGFKALTVYRGVGYKLGAWRDVGWWALRLCEKLPGEPLPPRRVADVRDSAAWQQALTSGERCLK